MLWYCHFKVISCISFIVFLFSIILSSESHSGSSFIVCFAVLQTPARYQSKDNTVSLALVFSFNFSFGTRIWSIIISGHAPNLHLFCFCCTLVCFGGLALSAVFSPHSCTTFTAQRPINLLAILHEVIGYQLFTLPFKTNKSLSLDEGSTEYVTERSVFSQRALKYLTSAAGDKMAVHLKSDFKFEPIKSPWQAGWSD